MEYYTDINEMKSVVEELINYWDKNSEDYDINEILDEVSDYDFDKCASYFTDSFENTEEFWEIAEKYKLDKDYSELSNVELLDNLEEAILDDDGFMIEQFRTEILKRMKWFEWLRV